MTGTDTSELVDLVELLKRPEGKTFEVKRDLSSPEAVINATVHADYAQRGAPVRIAIFDDRIEIENPGLLPFGLTVEDLEDGISKLRNRVIGRVSTRSD